MKTYDLVIIGSGPGGYVAAIRAGQLGKNVLLVEKESLGGVCLNWGCIPTKALLRSAEVLDLFHHSEELGITADNIQVDFTKVMGRSRRVAEHLSKGVQHLLKKHKITVQKGHARFIDSKTLEIEGESGKDIVTAPYIIIATGASPRALPEVSFDIPHVWSSKEALLATQAPKRLLIIGSGAIGIEFASFYRAMGSSVTVLEIQKRILPQEDQEIAALATKALTKRGITIHTSSTIASLKHSNEELDVTLDLQGKQESLSFDAMIVAIGVVPNSQNLGLEKTKIQTEKDQIVVDAWGETNEPGVYAIGDVTQGPWLAHKASHEGVIAVEKIFKVGQPHPLSKDRIPSCTYASPQIASIGLTEAQALEKDYDIKVGRFPFLANGKALAMGEPEGLIKTIFDKKTGELLGAHMIGAEVTELIQGFAVAKTLETTEVELMETIFPHPTLSEMMHESVLDAYDRVLHL